MYNQITLLNTWNQHNIVNQLWKKVKVLVAQLCLTLCDPVGCSPLGSSVHSIHQARILEWVAIPFSRRASRQRDQTQVSCTAGRFFTFWATRDLDFKNYIFSSFTTDNISTTGKLFHGCNMYTLPFQTRPGWCSQKQLVNNHLQCCLTIRL